MKESNNLPSIVMLPESSINKLLEQQEIILEKLKHLSFGSKSEYITAEEFMQSVRISRSTFDQLRADNQIKVIKKGRKLYLPSNAVASYFEE